MESIKPLDELTKPDERSAILEMVNPKTGVRRPIQIEDHYRRFSRVTLNVGVPQDIQDVVFIAANLYVYSWFMYSFGSIAELQCLAALEMALRRRAGIPDGDLGPGLRKLMKKAISENWIRDSGLPKPSSPTGDETSGETTGGDPQAQVKHMANSLPNWRNSIAHGTYMVFPPGNMMLGMVAGLINQLWPAPGGGV